MVQILREKTRQYVADQSGAIKTAQLAQNVGEWSSLIQNAGNLAINVAKQSISDTENAENLRLQAQKRQLALQQEADQNIINTEYGKTAHNATIGELDKLANRYGATSDRFSQEAYALAERNYAPQIEGMTTAEGRTAMETKLRNTKDYIDQYKTSARAKAIESSKAKIAAQNLVKNFGDEAYQQGTRQSYSDILGVDDYVDYVSKTTGNKDKDSIKANIEKEIATSRLMGVMDTDIVTAASALGDEEILRDHFTDVVNRAEPNASDKEKERLVEKLMSDKEKKATNDEDLRSVLGDKYVAQVEKVYNSYLDDKKVAIKREMSVTSEKSAKYKELKKELQDVEDKMSSEDGVLDSVRAELNATLGNQLKKRYEEYKLENKVESYKNAVNTWAYALDPDPITAQRAQFNIWASENGLGEKNSTEIGEWESKNMSKANPLMSPISDEINVEQFASDYQQYIKDSSTIKQQLHEEYEGTMEMHDLLQDLLNDNNGTPMQFIAKGYKAINAANKAPITESQRQTFNNLVAKAMQDKAFGDMMASVLNNSSRYYPDTTWLANAFGNWNPTQSDLAALPDSVARTDVTNVETMMRAKSKAVINDAMHAMLDVARLPEDQRLQAFQKISDGIIAEKKKIFNEAIMNYGIDLETLDNELNTKGRAYTRVGFLTKEYKGRDGNGNPIFTDSPTIEKITEAKKILDIINGAIPYSGLPKKGE